MGIEGVATDQLGAGLPPVLKGGRSAALEAVESTPRKSAVTVTKEPTSLLLDSPVRSGQSIFFPSGDVTVLGSVASGAEIVAGGSIHVYGTLRGRAMAGASGGNRQRAHLLLAGSKRSCWRSTASTERSTTWKKAFAHGRFRPGSKARL